MWRRGVWPGACQTATRVSDQLTSASVSIETATLLGRLKGTRGLWFFVALALLAPVTLWLDWKVVRAESLAPDIGLDIQRGSQRQARVAMVDDVRWAGVQAGDVVLTLNGQAVNTHDFWQHRTSLSPGQVTARFERDGTQFERTIETRAPKVSLAIAYTMRLLTGALLILIALGAFLMRPGGAVSWLFLLFVYAVGHVTMMTAGFIDDGLSLFLIIYGLLGLAPGFGLLLFTVFPRRLEVSNGLRAAMITPSLLLVVGHPLRLLLQGRDSSSLWLELLTRGWATVATGLLIGGQLWQARKAHRAGDERLASLYRMLSVASVLGLFAPVTLSGIARALQLDGSLVMEVSASLVVTFAVLTAVVLVRHNPLAIDRYATSVVGYVLTVGGLGVVYAFTLLSLPLVLNRFGLAQSTEALIGVTAAISISVGPVYRWLRRRVDRWFSEEQANVMQTADLLRSVVDAVQRKGQGEALDAIMDAAKVLGAEHVALWQLDAPGLALQRTRLRGPPVEALPLPREGAALVLLEKAGGVSGLAPTPLAPLSQQTLWGLGLVLSAPVRAHGVAVGFLGLGRRPSGFAYRPEDESFLGALAAQVGLALERSDVVTNIGRYRVEKRLAAGGMAEVFVAWQLGPGGFERKVALKRLLPELAEDPKHAASLLDEARIAARLSHRHIAQIYEVGLESGQHFIAMEFVEGPPLRFLIAAMKARQAPVPLAVWLQLTQALLSALSHAHAVKDVDGRPMGVVHRDVTPANVLVANTGEAKLVDFGLVLAETRLFRTETGIARGTLPYMSPEQAAGERVDARSDLYSAATTLFELLTLSRAFPEGPHGSKPLPASVVRPDLPRALDEVFALAFTDSRDARPATAEALATAFTGAAAVTPASEAEVSRWVQSLTGVALPERKSPVETLTAPFEAPTIPHGVKG